VHLLITIIYFCRNVLVKGGDLPNSLDSVDVFFDGEVQVFNSETQWT